jgi:hypothetical protein
LRGLHRDLVLTDRLGEVGCPVLMTWGREDRIIGTRRGRTLSSGPSADALSMRSLAASGTGGDVQPRGHRVSRRVGLDRRGPLHSHSHSF